MADLETDLYRLQQCFHLQPKKYGYMQGWQKGTASTEIRQAPKSPPTPSIKGLKVDFSDRRGQFRPI